MRALGRKFFERNTLTVAKDLLGCYIVRKIGSKIIRAMITDVEAYIGEDDLACHASKGRTPRSEVLYGEAGHAYVYLIYGMYHIMNVVTEKKDFPAAVMIRAVYPVKSATRRGAKQFDRVKIEGIDYEKTNGPGKVCRALNIKKEFHNFDVTKGRKLWIENGKMFGSKDIIATKRVGIAYAQHCAHYPWRFVLREYAVRK